MFASPAFAEAAGAAPAGGASTLLSFAPIFFIFIIFYFLLIRPQQKRMKEHRNTLEMVKKNDQIVTAGGIVAKVIAVGETEVDAEISPGVRVKIVKATIAEVRSAGTGKPAND